MVRDSKSAEVHPSWGFDPPLPAPDNLQPFNHFTALLPSTWAIAKKSVFEKLGLF